MACTYLRPTFVWRLVCFILALSNRIFNCRKVFYWNSFFTDLHSVQSMIRLPSFRCKLLVAFFISVFLNYTKSHKRACSRSYLHLRLQLFILLIAIIIIDVTLALNIDGADNFSVYIHQHFRSVTNQINKHTATTFLFFVQR